MRPALLRLGALFRAYRDEFCLTSPFQRLLFGLLGLLGCGKRATSPQRGGAAKVAG